MIIFKKALTFNNRYSRYLVQASYPVYLFHHPIIIGIMFFYVQWQITLPVFWGYTLVCGLALVMTYFLYEIIVRRNTLGAFLFTGK